MDRDSPPRPHRRLREGPGGLFLKHPLGQPVIYQLPCPHRLCVAQDQDGDLHPRPAQLNALLQTGHRQIIHPKLFQPAGHRNSSVTVGVGLYRGQQPAPLWQHSPKSAVIMLQSTQIDLRPSTARIFIHRDPFFI